MKVPYTLVIGKNELDNETVTYRLHGQSETNTVSKSKFIKLITKDIKTKLFKRI